jgi:hypothetical protein
MWMKKLRILGAATMLAMAGVAFATDAYAQTQGMDRRADRRDTRQTARDVKHKCNASGQSSRSGCRQAKRSVKQQGRQNRLSK